MRTYKSALILASLLATLVLATAARSSPMSKYCSNISLNGATFDLSWWINQGPFSKQDPTGSYTWTFAPCSSLDAPCPDNSDSGLASACPTANSAVSCQRWANTQNPSQPHSVCTAGVSSVPVFSQYVYQNDFGIVMTVGGGDDCVLCAPSTRATAFTVICDSNTTPNIISAANADLPSPVYNIAIRHCSGCPTSDPRFCLPAPQPDVVRLNVDFRIVDFENGTLSLLPLPTELKVSSRTGYDDIALEGTIENALNNTISFLVTSNGSPDKVTLSFLPQYMVALTFVDGISHQTLSCGKARRSGSLSMKCILPDKFMLALSGSIQ